MSTVTVTGNTRLCADCGSDTSRRPSNATRCAECQGAHRSGRPRSHGKRRLAPDRTCELCSAPFRPRGTLRRCGRCRYAECGIDGCALLVTAPSGYCTRHDRLLREHGDPLWRSLRQTYPAEYAVWASARNRITNPRNAEYHRYGGRGLVMCEHVAAFADFLHEVDPRPAPRLTLERLDNDLGYLCAWCNGGVRQITWATAVQQARNRSTSTGIPVYAEPVEAVVRGRIEAAAYPGVVYKPARAGRGRGVFEAYQGGRYLGRASTAQEAAELREAIRPGRSLRWVKAASAGSDAWIGRCALPIVLGL